MSADYFPPVKVGIGYDVHRLVKGRKLILGTCEVDYDLGLKGHSDADVLVHALMDAILGALGIGDIGEMFPDTDPAFKDISSSTLLAHVVEILESTPYRLGNADVIVIAQKPKLSPYRDRMRENLAKLLKIDKSCLNIKFTTEEGLGFTGRGEGIAAQAVCALILKAS